MKLFDTTFNALNKALDMRYKRHLVLSSNVANTETPNYQAREVNFAGELQRAMHGPDATLTKTNAMHMDLSSSEGAHVVIDQRAPIGADGNTVDLDVQMGKLSSNARSYTNDAELLSIKLRLLRQATSARGGV